MKPSRFASRFVVLIWLLLACAILGCLFFAVESNPFRRPAWKFTVAFEDVTGMKVGTPVLCSGIPAGRITSIDYGVDKRVHVQVAITNPTVQVSSDIRVYHAGTLLGESFLVTRPGNADVDDGRHPYSLPEEVVAKAGSKPLKEILDGDPKLILEGFSLSKLETVFPGIDTELKQASVAAKEDIRKGHAAIKKDLEQMQARYEELEEYLTSKAKADYERIVRELEQWISGRAGDAVSPLIDDCRAAVAGSKTNPGLKQRLSLIFANIEEASKGASVLLKVEGKGPQGANIPQLVTKLDGLVTSLKDASETLRNISDAGEAVTRSANRADAAARSIKDTSDQLRKGETWLSRRLFGKPK